MIIGQRSHHQSIRLPRVVRIEIVAPRRVHSQLIVRREVRASIGDGQLLGRRVGTCISDLCCTQLSQTDDQRLMVECLLVVDEVAVHTRLAQTRRAERCPPVDQLHRAVHLWSTVESIHEQIGKTRIQWSHLEVNGDGQRIGDVAEMHGERLSMW